MSEFSLIDILLSRLSVTRDDVILGPGDDGAVLDIPQGKQLVVSTDTLVLGTHFPICADPFAIGHKSLAVNLSDIASMGADPCWCSLSLTLPDNEIDYHAQWVTQFTDGFTQLAAKYDVQLIGGDMTKGPLSITVTIHGLVDRGSAITRSGALENDDMYVSGSLGNASYELSLLHSHSHTNRNSLDYPQPRVLLGKELISVASACIDVSDGLLADLSHLLSKSNVSADIWWDKIPCGISDNITKKALYKHVLGGGDDYELLFTAPKKARKIVENMSEKLGLAISRIGTIHSDKPTLKVTSKNDVLDVSDIVGFDHFLHEL